jgi:ribosome-associated protein
MDTAEDVVRVDASLSVPRSELNYRATRSGGPGGQHVNTSSTRVELTWDVAQSPSLTAEQRERLLTKLGRRIDARGVLRLVAAGSRSQHQNREAVTERFAAVVAQALRVPKPRRRTRPPRSASESRLREKKQRTETKRLRSRPPED